MKEGAKMRKGGRKILFDGCNYDCFNCSYPDCYCPDQLVKQEYTLEKQRLYLKRTRERALKDYERRKGKK